MTAQEFQARRIERIAAALAHFVATTPEKRLEWCPKAEESSTTRSIFTQAGECVKVNQYVAALLRGESPELRPAVDGRPPIEFRDSEDARNQLIASGQELANAVRGLSDSDLDRTFSHWRGPIRGEVLLEMPYRNMAYHSGQVNMIQMLAGDAEFHLPPTWL